MKKITFLALFVLLFISIAGAEKTDATTMLRYTVSDLTKKSDNIIIGKVIMKKSEWNPNRTQIHTYTTIQIESEIKGATKNETITVKELGGVVDDIGQKAEGAAEYEVGEDVLLFLNKVEGNYRTVGMVQGKYNIIEDKITGNKIVKNKIGEGVRFMNSDGTEAAAPKSGEISYNNFLSTIISNITYEE